MAIGSGAEIGVTFGRWGDMTPDDKQAWIDYMMTDWHPWLYNGYATLHYPRRYPNGNYPQATSEESQT